MQFILRCLTKPLGRQNHYYRSRRTFIDAATIKCVRDRGLDHAVEKERNLRPVLNLKNLIISEPSRALPLSVISQNKETLNIPIRPIEFIRKYPSIFHEFFPGGIGIHPHVKLTPEVLDLDAEEQLIYQSESYKKEAADRLLKLLMIGRTNKIPLNLVDRLKWDLGLPRNYVKSIVPEFPDYFRVNSGDDPMLELVCWSNELAVSVMEKKVMNGEIGYKKGMPIAFSIQCSRGFEMDKKYKKWVDEWQKLPYISPYENALHLASKSDESDKWAVAVLHEVLNLFVAKKSERDNVLCFGEYLGLRSRFKMALFHHPGIFYLSTKIGMHTVVLRDAFKRDLLIEKHPLMNMRFKYIHLMNSVREDNKLKNAQDGSSRQQKATCDSAKGDVEDLEDNESEQDRQLHDLSGSEFGDGSDDEHRNNMIRGRTSRKTKFEEKGPSRAVAKNYAGRYSSRSKGANAQKNFRRSEMPVGEDVHRRSLEKSDFRRTRGKTNLDRRTFT